MEFISRALGAQKKEKRCLRSDGGDKGGSTPPGGPAGRNLNFGCSQMPSPCISQRVLTLTLTLISNPNPIPKPVQTCFSAYFRCSQVCFPCISQRLLTLTNDTHPLFLTQYVQYSFVLITITLCSLCIVSFVSISYSVFRGRVVFEIILV